MKTTQLMFSPNFMVSGLTFKSLIHFSFFNMQCEKMIYFHFFFFFTRSGPAFPALSFPHCIFLSPFAICCYYLVALTVYAWVCFQALYSVSLVYGSVLHHYHAVSITIALQYSLRPCSMIPLALYMFLKITLNIQVLLWFRTNLRIVYSSSVKNAMDISIKIALNLQTFLGSMYILTILILQIHEHESLIWVIFSFFQRRRWHPTPVPLPGKSFQFSGLSPPWSNLFLGILLFLMQLSIRLFS